MADDAFHEIQLNGKQLVFLFMSATVVAVVIFLSGIMVGRGVREARGELAAATDENIDPTAGTTPPPSAAVTGANGASAATRESLTYPDRLSADAPAPEVLKEPEGAATAATPDPAPAASKKEPPASVARVTPAASASAVPASASALRATADKSASAPGASSDKSADKPGFTVQVAAIKERDEADRIAKRLTAKGYPAYVTTPANGSAVFFRVRVGKYQDRREAEAMARRLETEEQFRPWVTR